MPGTIIPYENEGVSRYAYQQESEKGSWRKEELNMPIKGISKNRRSQRQGSISTRSTSQVYSGPELVKRFLMICLDDGLKFKFTGDSFGG